MKKLLAILIASVLLVLGMAVTATAADYVYYENDFSDPGTLSDFTVYRGEWSIADGQLMLTGIGDLGMDQFCHLLFTKDEGIMNLTDYVAEVDLYNIQTSAGLIVRGDVTKANGDTSNSFYGYLGFVSNNGTKVAFGRADGIGGWAGNMNVSGAVTQPGANVRIKVIVEGNKITCVATDLGTDSEIYKYEAQNSEWALGSFGLRAAIMQSGLTNLALVGFDNLKITAIGKVGDWLASGKALKDYDPGVSSELLIPEITEAIEVTVPEVVRVEASALDTSKTEYVFYENDFSDPATIADFTQYRGKWEVKDGALYYSELTTGFEATNNFSFILYSGNHDANLLQNYTVEFDVLNSQTALGVLSHCDLSQANSNSGNTFYGYCSFIGNNGTIGATGYCNWEGTWGGNLKVGEAVLTPGSDYHLKVEHTDGIFHYTITAVGSDEVIWEDTQIDADWPQGSFGVRMRVALDDLVCLDNTRIDNMKVTVYGEEAVLLNAGYHPNAEIVGELNLPSNTTEAPAETTEAPVETTAASAAETASNTPAETTAAPAATTAPTSADVEQGAPVALLIGIGAAVLVIVIIVFAVLKKKKN